MKCKIEWLITTQHRHHCIITNVTDKNKTVCLDESVFTLDWIEGDPQKNEYLFTR